MNLGHLLLSCQGRINRSRFWIGFLIVVPLMIWTSTVTSMWLALIGAPRALLIAVMVGFAILVYAAFLPVAVKRLHDLDKSGWWLGLYFLAGIAMNGIAYFIDEDGGIIASVLSYAVTIGVLVELGLLPGTHGPNRFGPDRLAP